MQKCVSSERCAELIIIAASHNLNEAWISYQPVLLVMYLVQYMPFIGFWLMDKTRACSTSTYIDTNELFTELKEKWDGLGIKTTVIIYGRGAIVAVCLSSILVWLSSILVGAINSVPMLPKVLELVGLGFTGWFVYRYLLLKSSRKELAEDIGSLKKKITGTE
ncbi:protein CURVATURE THYLAKOID 1A, chloroplastic-like [Raphanus sativus]|uniref:Protein CURVATURE THYLAKOID 1A, chloroplastic-like n=1 Tax=Raphanus sativus TaxID=3726 RepID=A0A6J0P0A7_RAPSA|nr:protein CURVATURE THYLAKOID 1A, chloroplastic-like [Raphanus sativus]